MSPSGKAHGFDPCIRRFESGHPSHTFFGGIIMNLKKQMLLTRIENLQTRGPHNEKIVKKLRRKLRLLEAKENEE